MMEPEKYAHEDDFTAADTSMISSTSPYQPTTEPVSNRRLVFGGFILHLQYVKSLSGILKAVEILFSIIVAACVGSIVLCGTACGAAQFMQFVSISSIIMCTILYVVFTFGLHNKLDMIHWPLTELFDSIVSCILYIISSSVLAANSIFTVYQSATAFGFLSAILFAASVWFAYQQYKVDRAKRHPSIAHIEKLDENQENQELA
uniref:MARVEL domain-containing protein n=1 Tax=Ciona savignyi TaxID=51511 RepID=H2Z447_CIOSA